MEPRSSAQAQEREGADGGGHRTRLGDRTQPDHDRQAGAGPSQPRLTRSRALLAGGGPLASLAPAASSPARLGARNRAVAAAAGRGGAPRRGAAAAAAASGPPGGAAGGAAEAPGAEAAPQGGDSGGRPPSRQSGGSEHGGRTHGGALPGAAGGQPPPPQQPGPGGFGEGYAAPGVLLGAGGAGAQEEVNSGGAAGSGRAQNSRGHAERQASEGGARSAGVPPHRGGAQLPQGQDLERLVAMREQTLQHLNAGLELAFAEGRVLYPPGAGPCQGYRPVFTNPFRGVEWVRDDRPPAGAGRASDDEAAEEERGDPGRAELRPPSKRAAPPLLPQRDRRYLDRVEREEAGEDGLLGWDELARREAQLLQQLQALQDQRGQEGARPQAWARGADGGSGGGAAGRETGGRARPGMLALHGLEPEHPLARPAPHGGDLGRGLGPLGAVRPSGGGSSGGGSQGLTRAQREQVDLRLLSVYSTLPAGGQDAAVTLQSMLETAAEVFTDPVLEAPLLANAVWDLVYQAALGPMDRIVQITGLGPSSGR
ncbi:hypothetical protein HXX76_015926 [Chlamydomonas incerta]|uniref:Uncharacterized protein n=1 Tax=Chlamydomonas incerta TaxID=51695 RepID=A0A835VR90_CHLIN|nr:hypothetical protein HXX76_015926 [Chlamydomonas incerta]|eukprot:KAG2422546.1 hypothetical protein HXX76_015926 [Chlamydomonas incerta]